MFNASPCLFKAHWIFISRKLSRCLINRQGKRSRSVTATKWSFCKLSPKESAWPSLFEPLIWVIFYIFQTFVTCILLLMLLLLTCQFSFLLLFLRLKLGPLVNVHLLAHNTATLPAHGRVHYKHHWYNDNFTHCWDSWHLESNILAHALVNKPPHSCIFNFWKREDSATSVWLAVQHFFFVQHKLAYARKLTIFHLFTKCFLLLLGCRLLARSWCINSSCPLPELLILHVLSCRQTSKKLEVTYLKIKLWTCLYHRKSL